MMELSFCDSGSWGSHIMVPVSSSIPGSKGLRTEVATFRRQCGQTQDPGLPGICFHWSLTCRSLGWECYWALVCGKPPLCCWFYFTFLFLWFDCNVSQPTASLSLLIFLDVCIFCQIQGLFRHHSFLSSLCPLFFLFSEICRMQVWINSPWSPRLCSVFLCLVYFCSADSVISTFWSSSSRNTFSVFSCLSLGHFSYYTFFISELYFVFF